MKYISPRLIATYISFLVLTAHTAFAQVEPSASHWEVLPDKSSIEWTANYAGKPIAGSFKEFTSDIAFDPEKLDASRIMVKIETAKIISDDKDAEQSLPTAEWFDSATFPQAIFEAKTFRHIEEDNYEAEGTLTIGGKNNPLILPFTAHFYDDKDTAPPARYAQVTTETVIKRSDYGIGKGDWSKTDVISDDVKVVINIKAKESAQPVTTAP